MSGGGDAAPCDDDKRTSVMIGGGLLCRGGGGGSGSGCSCRSSDGCGLGAGCRQLLLSCLAPRGGTGGGCRSAAVRCEVIANSAVYLISRNERLELIHVRPDHRYICSSIIAVCTLTSLLLQNTHTEVMDLIAISFIKHYEFMWETLWTTTV